MRFPATTMRRIKEKKMPLQLCTWRRYPSIQIAKKKLDSCPQSYLEMSYSRGFDPQFSSLHCFKLCVVLLGLNFLCRGCSSRQCACEIRAKNVTYFLQVFVHWGNPAVQHLDVSISDGQALRRIVGGILQQQSLSSSRELYFAGLVLGRAVCTDELACAMRGRLKFTRNGGRIHGRCSS